MQIPLCDKDLPNIDNRKKKKTRALIKEQEAGGKYLKDDMDGLCTKRTNGRIGLDKQ